MASNHPVATTLRGYTASRRLRPGDRLPPERRLAEELGISRNAVREGIVRLTELGVVERRRGAGMFLADVDLGHLLEVRLRLEPFAAELAAARCGTGKAACSEIKALRKELRATVTDARAFAAADARLHQLVAQLSGNRVLESLLTGLSEITAWSRARTAVDNDLRSANLGDLDRLCRALVVGDTTSAGAAMEAHLRRLATAVATRAEDDE